MLHSNRLLLCLHLLLLMSVLLSCLGHGSLLLRASRMLTTHLLLLLEQVGRKVDKRSLAHLSIPHCLQLLCLCLVQVHGIERLMLLYLEALLLMKDKHLYLKRKEKVLLN
jgi:hypothetical protein